MNAVARLEKTSLNQRLQQVNLLVEEGQCVVLVGPNGAGKSTALRALAGLETPTSGRALVGNQDACRMRARERAGLVSWLPQRPHLEVDLHAEELVAQARYRFSEPSFRSLEHARRVLDEVGIAHLIGRSVSRISGGELQRVLIATLVAQEAPLLLVDEPANHLDPAHQIDTYKRLGNLWKTGRGLCIVTHDIRLCLLLGRADEIDVVGLQDGEVNFMTHLSDPDLPAALESLYGVPFVPREAPGGLSLLLPEGSE